MGWVIKYKHNFNKFIGKNEDMVSSIAEAKEYRTKKEATSVASALAKSTNSVLEVLKVIKK